MIVRPEALEKLLSLLRSLPSVGPKMSERIALHLLKRPEEEIRDLIQTIQETYQKVRPCPQCGYWDDSSPCRVCQDSSRDEGLVCVVEGPQDLIAMSRVGDYNGLYHVLGGALSPLEGVGPQDLRIDPLLDRLKEGKVREVILALSADIEGESTAQYLTRQIHAINQKNGENGPAAVRITRLAQGMPAGGELEYMDELTLLRALEGRREVRDHQ